MGNRLAPEGAPRNPEPDETLKPRAPRGSELPDTGPWDEGLRGIPRPRDNPSCGLQDPVMRHPSIGDTPPIGPKTFRRLAGFIPK